MTDPINYEEIVWNIRADAAKISGARNDAYALTQPAASTAPTFDEYSKSLGYQNLDYEAKNQVQQSWLAQHGSTWKQAGANPKADLASFAKNDKPKFEITNTDWIDRFAQAAIQSGASQFNVIANEMQPGVIKDFLSNRGQQGLLDAKAIEQKFSPLTLDTMKKEARVAAELDKKYGGNIPATEEVRQALVNIGGDPIGRIASAAGSSVTQFPGMAVQAVGGALAATGVGVGPGAALIAGGKVLSTALGASSVAGEVGQGAFDEVMKLTPKQLYSHPTFQAALSEAKKVGLSEDSANLAAQRAVASEAMSFGARMGAIVGAVGGVVSANLGTGAIAQQAGKQAAKHFLKHAGIEMATEGVEGAITQVAQNKAAQSGGVDVALGKGVIAAGIEEAYGGLGQSAAASGIGKTVGALADIAKATPVKAPDVVTAPTTTPETLAKRMEHMPEYVKTMAEDLVNTIVATPNPTPEVKAEIDAAKSALLGLGFTQADLDGLYGTTVKADAVVSPDKTVSPVVNPGNPEQVTVGSYKPAETGGEPGTQAPTRLVTELAAQGPIILESINQKAVDHEKGYSGWVQSTQSEPSRVPKQEFISGTADNMVLTALQLGLPMDKAAQSYAQELQSTQATGSGNNSASNLGSRLTADGKSLVSESDYQASQLGTVPDLVGKYVLYGNVEGYVVQRPQGLYVVDTRPGNTQDIFIEGGESQSTPAQLGVQLLSTPTVKVPTKRQGSGTSVSQQVETAQLTYDQILFNDALDLLVMSMEPAQAEAVLTAIDARLGDGATTAQVAKEIENAINKFDQQGSAGEVIDPTQNTQFTSEGFSASSSTDVSPRSKNGLAETANQIKTRHTIASTRAKLESWLYGLDPKLEGKTLDEMLPDVMLLENLPGQVIAGMEDRKIKTGLPFQDAYGVDTENVKDQAVNGFRDGKRGITVLFTKNMNVDADPISTLIHETWHKFQGRESDGGIIATANSWANKPAGSVENTAYLNGLQATQGTDITKGQQEFIPYILNSLWEQGVRPGQGTEASGWVDKALAYLQKLVDFVVMKATGNPRKLTPQELMDIAVGLVRDDANGVNINKWLGPKEKVSSQPSFSVADIAKLSDKNMPLKEFSQQFAGDIKQSDKTVEQANKIANSYVLGVTTGSSDYLPNVTGASLSYKQYLMMPDGLTYDPANVNHITATDLTKSIYEAVKSGKIEQALVQEAKSINESRAKDLGVLARYLRNNPDYRPTEAAVILKAASKWGMRLTTNNDKSVVQLVEITNKNATAIAVLNGLDASSLAEKLFEGMPLKAAFQAALQKNADAREKAAKDSGKEGWVVYKKSDKHEDAVALRDGVAGREWCTAGAVSTAAGQLSQGDFHVFYKNGQPLVALRTVDGRLGEAPRGSLPGQALTEFERGIAERRLHSVAEHGPSITGAEDFLADQKVLVDIQSGAIKGYSDIDLWMLRGYMLRAGDYIGTGLPPAATSIVEQASRDRRSLKEWEGLGYYDAGPSTKPNFVEWDKVKFLNGDAVLPRYTKAPLLEVVDSLLVSGGAEAPKLQIVLGGLFVEGDITLPKLTTVKGTLYTTSDNSLPSLQAVRELVAVNRLRPDSLAIPRGVKIAPLVTDSLRQKYSSPGWKELGLIETPVEQLFGKVDPTTVAQPTTTSSKDFLDYSMFTPNQPKTLSEKLDVINSGRLKAKVPDWQQIKDKTAEYLVDVSRPFDVWARSFGSAADQARLLQNKALAKTRAGALTSEIDAKFSQPLAKALQNIVSAKHAADISAAKEMVGEWITVRYAQIKNADFITQDQQAVDDASPGSFEHQDALDKQTKRLSAINSSNDNLDPTQTQLDAGVAGGYNNATAAKVQGLIEAKVPVAMLEAAAQPVYDMLKYKATLDIKTGKIAVSQSVKWLNSPYYVPLTGDPRNDDSTSDVFGTGSLNQGKDKKAVGRTGSLAQNGIDAAYEQIAKSTNYHGWLPFKQELTSTYEKLMVDAGGDVEKVWKDSGIKRFREGPGVDIQNSIVVRNGADVTKNGSGWVYTLDSQDAIDGLRRVNLEAPNSFLAAIGWGTTIMSKMVTMWMPGFAVINSWRDGPERFTNLWTRTLANYPDLDMGKVALQATGYFADPRTLLTTRVVVAEKLGMFEWAKALSDSIPDFTPGDSSLLSEMLKAGASSTTGSYLSRDSSQLAEKLAKINRWDTKTKNLLVIWNDSFELKAPFAMYKALRNNGVDEKAAAATVLATMDFGKTGRAMAPIKALYMFAQPIATGSHQLFLTAGTTKGQVAGVAMLAASMGLYAMLSEMGGEDELLKKKKLDELGSFTLERSIPVPIGNNTYLKVPVPFGLFQLAWASGVNLMRGITGVQTPVETVGELLKLGVKTFAPVSPSEVPIMRDPATWFMQTLAPSFIGKTIVNVASNKTAFGGTLDNRANVKPGEPMWKMARKDTPELYVSASKWLLQNFNVNTSPEVIHEWLKGLTPGVLNEGTKAYIDNPAKDARGVPHVNQWFDRYLVQQTDSQFIDRLYYKAQAEVLDLRLKKNSDTKSAGNPLTEKENQLNAALRGDDNAESNIRKQWGALRKQNNEGLLTPEQYKTRYQQLDKQETDARRRFLVRYNELTK